MTKRALHSRIRRGIVAVTVAAAASAAPLIVSASPASAAVLPVGSSGGANLVFSDEFEGTSLNTGKWHTCSWWSTTTCSIETNKELELYTKNNVSVANGVLKLQARRENATAWNGKTYNYTSGMVSTGGRSGEIAPGFTFRYGYMEARVKVPSGKGLWPAFWSLPADYSWPPEIDVMEILGDDPRTTYMHYHYNDASGSHVGPGSSWTGPDFSAGWHTFGADWQPGSITYYVDGVERWRFTDAAVTSKASYLLLNLAVGGNWPGSPDASTAFPADYLVDYVRVWDRFGTPGTPTTAAPTTTTTKPPATTTTTAAAPTTTTTVPPPAPSGYAATVAADRPISHWRLGESSGTAAADAMGRNGGSYVNGVRQGQASLLPADPANPAATFDGSNDMVSVNSSASLSPTSALTVEAWVRPSSIPASGQFASVVTKAESYSIQLNGNRLEFTTMRSGVRRRVQAPAGTVLAGQAYHVVGTFNGTNQRLYVNGTLVASANFSGTFGVNNNRLLIGSWDAGSEFLNGTVDDVAVYGTVLSPTQISTHYNRGRSRT